jgi:hypothetical protein
MRRFVKIRANPGSASLCNDVPAQCGGVVGNSAMREMAGDFNLVSDARFTGALTRGALILAGGLFQTTVLAISCRIGSRPRTGSAQATQQTVTAAPSLEQIRRF